MEQQEKRHFRLYTLAIFLIGMLLIYLGILYDLQVNQHENFLAQSIRNITRTEKVEASRGMVTDRNGQVLISSYPTYQLTFDTSLLKKGEDTNEAILRLLKLFQSREITWVEELPLSKNQPFTYTVDSMPAIQRGRFLKYLGSLKSTSEALGAYLLRHPELLQREDESGVVTNPADLILADENLTDTQRGQQLLEKFPSSALTSQLLLDAGIEPQKLVDLMRENMKISETFSITEARDVMGVRYELAVRNLVNTTAYVMVEDVNTELISLLSDGRYSGAKVTSSSIRIYETDYAAHILGTMGPIEDRAELEKLGEGYKMDDQVGRDGVEMAFEKYLKGTDGTRVVSMNNDGKITDEYWSVEPEPGGTVELTIDMHVQQVMEDTLKKTVENMNRDGITRGAGAVLLNVHNAEVLAMASYPTYQLSTFRENFSELNADPARPMLNRATKGVYAPGSTYKPLTALAALEEGKVTIQERINDTGYWVYPDLVPGTARFGYYCWNRGGHGRLNVTGAINHSCNYYFSEMGYRLGIDLLSQYATAFGLGQKTGIEIGEYVGILAGPEEREAKGGGTWYGGDTVQSAWGQSDHQFTPIQLANYIATLVNGGNHYQAHLLKAVKSYDNSHVIAVGSGELLNVVEMKDENIHAVKEGMRELTTVGSVSGYFKRCVVSAGAKTGTVQLNNTKNNGVFVCFAPYEDPEVALAVVIERGGSGAALASTAVEILNAYFSTEEVETSILGENQLIQ